MIATIMFPYNKNIIDCSIKEEIPEQEYIQMLRTGNVNQKYLKYIKTSDYDSFFDLNGNIFDMNENEIDIKFFQELNLNKKMGVIVLIFENKNILDDVNDEIISWVRESRKILNHSRLNDDEKILSLPEKALKIKINNFTIVLDGSKIVNIYSLNKWQILFRKIIFIN